MKLLGKKTNRLLLILLLMSIMILTSAKNINFMTVLGVVFLVIVIKKIKERNNQAIKTPSTEPLTPTPDQTKRAELKCKKCNEVLQVNDKFCSNCGEPFDGNNVIVFENSNASIQVLPKISVLPSNFDMIYSLSEDMMLEEFINKELTKAGIDQTLKLVPSDILKKKRILNYIFSILVFVYISLIFFHFPMYTYIIGAILLFIFFKVTRKYSLIKYLKKQLKARPEEKISNIVMGTKNTLITDTTKKNFVVSLLISVMLPLIVFSSPRIIYEKMDNGYGVRFYTFGLTNFKTATIPETYKSEKVISLRGNTFSNMPFLESVTLPDSIIEIRGQAFKNCKKLKEVNIPKNLEYLGGGSFYNAKSIKSIELPDTLTYLGGETFYGASSLENIKLSNNLTEIRGNTFENCVSLKSITIPDNITRIGGHAFYNNSSLSEVRITENSKLNEIGSSAFRKCTSLYDISIPSGTSVNERAFKESPTTVNYFYSSFSTNSGIFAENVNQVDLTNYSLYYIASMNLNKSFNFFPIYNGKNQNEIEISLVSKNNDTYYFEYKNSNKILNFYLYGTSPYVHINDIYSFDNYTMDLDYVIELVAYDSENIKIKLYSK